MVNKFKRTDSVTDEHRTGRPAVAKETVQSIEEAIYTQPLSINQKTKHGTWYRTHHCVENKHAYHIQIVHKLEDEGYAARQSCVMTYWMLLEMKI